MDEKNGNVCKWHSGIEAELRQIKSRLREHGESETDIRHSVNQKASWRVVLWIVGTLIAAQITLSGVQWAQAEKNLNRIEAIQQKISKIELDITRIKAILEAMNH